MNYKTLFILLIISSFVSGFRVSRSEWKAPAEADQIINPLKYSESNIRNGKKLFDSACWSCHGSDGKGNGPASVALQVKPADFSDIQVQHQTDGAIYWKLSTGKGMMAGYSQTLSSTQRWQLVWYIRQFKPAASQ
jgi:mono/diheme cytochrome c family protein